MGATLGRLGALVWDGRNFLLCPGFDVEAVDTTGAGDIFHGAFLCGLLGNWRMEEILEFSCAAAALNCTAPGARGGIATMDEIAELRKNGRRTELAYSLEALAEASRSAVYCSGPENSGVPLKDLNPRRTIPDHHPCYTIAANVLVFIHQITLPPAAAEAFIKTYALTPSHIAYALEGHRYTPLEAFLPLFTCMPVFARQVSLHTIGNMWFLWIFGGNVEDQFGPLWLV